MDPVYTKQAIKWLSDPGNHKNPWFMTLSLVNPHDVASFPRFYPQRKLRKIRTEKLPDNWQDDLSGKPAAQAEYRELYTKLGGRIETDDVDGWRRYLDYFMFCTEDMDGNVGKVMDALNKSGVRDNTIVVFHIRPWRNGRLAWASRKRTHLYMKKKCVSRLLSPRLVLLCQRGTTTDAMSSNIDVMPTLLSQARISSGTPYQAGEDLTPVIFDPKSLSAR